MSLIGGVELSVPLAHVSGGIKGGVHGDGVVAGEGVIGLLGFGGSSEEVTEGGKHLRFVLRSLV